MIVSHEHGFVFMKTRKTAGTSVEIALSRVCGPDDVITPIVEDDEALRRAAGGRGPQHFEAPPLERKAFNHMPVSMVRRMLGRKKFESYFSFAIERNPWDAVVSLYHWKYRSSEPGDFAEYVASEAVETFATKNQRIYRLDGRVAVDRVLRYESLAEELADGLVGARPARLPRPAARQGRHPAARGVVPLLLRRRLAGAGRRAVRGPDRRARLRVLGCAAVRRRADPMSVVVPRVLATTWGHSTADGELNARRSG